MILEDLIYKAFYNEKQLNNYLKSFQSIHLKEFNFKYVKEYLKNKKKY